jgi:hypothetical protein
LAVKRSGDKVIEREDSSAALKPLLVSPHNSRSYFLLHFLPLQQQKMELKLMEGYTPGTRMNAVGTAVTCLFFLLFSNSRST